MKTILYAAVALMGVALSTPEARADHHRDNHSRHSDHRSDHYSYRSRDYRGHDWYGRGQAYYYRGGYRHYYYAPVREYAYDDYYYAPPVYHRRHGLSLFFHF